MSNNVHVNWDKLLNSLIFNLRPEKNISQHLVIGNDSMTIDGVARDFSDYSGVNIATLGKAAVQDMEALQDIFRSSPLADRLGQSVAFTKIGHGKGSSRYQCYESAHPYPDSGCLDAGILFKKFLMGLNSDALLILGVSGGASSLVVSPLLDYSLEEKVNLTRTMINGGASIDEINLLRRCLSELKNGGVARHSNAKDIVTLISSDIPSNDISVVGSGPTFYQKISKEKALKTAKKYVRSKSFSKFEKHIHSSEFNEWQRELSNAVDRKNITNVCVADYRDLFRQTEKLFNPLFEKVDFVRPAMDAPVEQGVQIHLQEIKKLLDSDRSWLLVSGGELPVKVIGPGQGGRATEFVLRMAQKIFVENDLQLDRHQLERFSICSVGTDGTDGPTEYAGAWLDFVRYLEARDKCGEPEMYLKKSNSLGYFLPINSAIKTGPTGINLMDLRLIAYK